MPTAPAPYAVPPAPAAASGVSIRALAPSDLPAVVALDALAQGRTRREYVERRLAAARLEPQLHAQFAAEDAQGLAGYLLARVLAGEFGRARPSLRLELVGVRPGLRRAGLGARLFEALASWAQRHDVGEVRTAAHWRDTAMLAWFGSLGFALAPNAIVQRAIDGTAPIREDEVDEDAAYAGHGSSEIDYGGTEANDRERYARGRADVRPMTTDDVAPIARIDRAITGRDRRAYIAARLAETMSDSAVRVSLSAWCDGAIVGYLMARADLGDFGRAEPVALLDTLGVDPSYARRGVGTALVTRLVDTLGALHVEAVETVVDARDLGLLGFLYASGFSPSQRLPFVRTLAGAR